MRESPPSHGDAGERAQQHGLEIQVGHSDGDESDLDDVSYGPQTNVTLWSHKWSIGSSAARTVRLTRQRRRPPGRSRSEPQEGPAFTPDAIAYESDGTGLEPVRKRPGSESDQGGRGIKATQRDVRDDDFAEPTYRKVPFHTSLIQPHLVEALASSELMATRDDKNILETFTRNLAVRLTAEFLTYSSKTGLQGRASPQNGSVSSSSQSNINGASTYTYPGSGKRARQATEDGDDDGDDGDGKCKKARSKRARRTKELPARLFACPYYKFDPQRYSAQNLTEQAYRGCASGTFREVARVKQHLSRVHKRPDWYCGSCYEEFEERAELMQHNRMRPPCEEKLPRYEEMMTDIQVTDIERQRGGNEDPETWYRIFKTLFPEAPRPLSPYVSNVSEIAVYHFVDFFRTFGPNLYIQQLQQNRARSEQQPVLQASTQAVVDAAFEIAFPAAVEHIEGMLQSANELTPDTAFDTPTRPINDSATIENNEIFDTDLPYGLHRPQLGEGSNTPTNMLSDTQVHNTHPDLPRPEQPPSYMYHNSLVGDHHPHPHPHPHHSNASTQGIYTQYQHDIEHAFGAYIVNGSGGDPDITDWVITSAKESVMPSE